MFTLEVIDSGIAYEFYSRKSLIEPILLDASSYFKRLGLASIIPNFQTVARELMSKVINHNGRNSSIQKVNLYIRRMKGKALFEITIQGQGEGFKFAKLEFQPLPGDSRQLKKRDSTFFNELIEDVQFAADGSMIIVYLKVSDT